MLTRGAVFIHDRILDPHWRPGPEERYSDAPKATMKVFRVVAHTVWYGYVGDTRSGWRMSREEFENRFPETA